MAVWYIVLLSVIFGAVATEHPTNNSSFPLEEINATAESRGLDQVQLLLQTLSDNIKVLNEGIADIKRDISSLFIAQNETNKSLENVSEQLQNFSILATQRMIDQEYKLERLQEDRLADRVDELIRDISSLFVVQNETQEMLITTNKSITQRMLDQEHKLERLPEVIRDISSMFVVQNETNEMIKGTNKSFTQRMMNLEQTLEPLPQIIRDTNEMCKTANETFTQRMTILERKVDRLPKDTGVYLIQPDPSKKKRFEVFRDWIAIDGFGGDWIVFQRRFNGSVDFYRNWTEYRKGFGDLRCEHWLGLDKLHTIVKTRRHELLIVLEDFDGVIAYAHYDDFMIGDESEKYIVKSIGNYTGTAGDSFTFHKDGKFTTYDQDNDRSDSRNCSEYLKGAWWFRYCHYSHLNGQYMYGKTNRHDEGVFWYAFRGDNYSLKSSKMMVRPAA